MKRTCSTKRVQRNAYTVLVRTLGRKETIRGPVRG